MLQALAMVCLAAAWLVPNHYFPWNSFYNESTAAVAVLLLSVGLGKGWFAQRLPAPVWVMVAVAAIPALQWTFGLVHFSGDALVSCLYAVGVAAAMGAGYVWARRDCDNAVVGLGTAFLAGSLASSVVAIAQAFEIRLSGIWVMDAISGMRAYANLGQPNNLATLLGMGAAALWALHERSKVNATWAGLASTVLVVAAAATQSRAAFAFGPIVFGFLLFARWRDIPVRTSLGGVVVATAAHWGLTWFLPTVQELMLLAGTDSLALRGSQSLRFALWPMMIEAVGEAPLTGYGWLQVGAAHLAVADRHPITGELWLHAHNLFVDILVWCGYPLGLLLIGALLYWWGSRCWRVRTIEGVAGMAIVTVFGWHSMLELPHHYAYFLLPVGLWAGLVEAETRCEGGRGWFSAKLNLLPLLLGLLMTLAIWKDYAAVEEDYRLIRFENLGIGSLRASQPAPDAPFMSAQTTFLRIARLAPTSGMSAQDLADMEAVTTRYPYGRAMARLGWAWALNGRLPDALVIYEKLRRMHGPAMYGQVKGDLRREVEGGNAGLKPLLDALPD